MNGLTKVCLLTALVVALLGFGVADSTAVESHVPKNLHDPDRAVLAARASAEDSSKVQDREIAVVRPGLPTMIFDDDSAIAASLTSTRAKLHDFEAALAKDLAHRRFYAPQTRRVVSTSGREVAAQSTSDELALTRSEFTRLKEALGEDLADADFRAPHTHREVAERSEFSSGKTEDSLASGAVSVSDEMLSLEMAMELDIHAEAFTAIETHFAIDGRRWKVD